jgi:hypothetical protein
VTNVNASKGLGYSINGYRIKIRISKNPLLLVEGRSDRHFFERLLYGARKRGYGSPESIQIDTANKLQDEKMRGMGNREKVEMICAAVIQEIPNDKYFCGFADREFRGFEIDDIAVQDAISDHYTTGSLVWSRGHSVENYYFDLVSFRKSFELSSPIHIAHVEAAINLFEKIFESILHLSCAISLAARDSEYLSDATAGPVKQCIHWSNLNISQDTININGDKWKKILQETGKSERFFARYNYWYQRLATIDRKILRWLCHGHIGFILFWEAYARCIYETCSENEEHKEKSKWVSYVSRLREDMRFHVLTTNWLEKALDGEVLYPQVVLEKLGIIAPAGLSSFEGDLDENIRLPYN